MEIRHEFPTGIVAMEPISLDLSDVTADAALKAIEIARNDSWEVRADFLAALDEAERLITNTGSIFGHAHTDPVDTSGSGSLCHRCFGAKVVVLTVNEEGQLVHGTCPDCGGTGIDGPVIHTR